MSEPIRVVRGQPSEHDLAALISVAAHPQAPISPRRRVHARIPGLVDSQPRIRGTGRVVQRKTKPVPRRT